MANTGKQRPYIKMGVDVDDTKALWYEATSKSWERGDRSVYKGACVCVCVCVCVCEKLSLRSLNFNALMEQVHLSLSLSLSLSLARSRTVREGLHPAQEVAIALVVASANAERDPSFK